MPPEQEHLRTITHDMRNLLTAVRGHAELALRGISEEDAAREDVAHVVVVTAALFELIDQIDGNDSSGTLIATNLDASVNSMRRLLDALLPPGIDIELRTGARGVHVTLPKLRIERIVLNLALNARDAMGDAGRLAIATTGDGDTAEIRVIDSGTGFSDEALAHLFESGFSTKLATGGSGLGLAALKRIVDAVGGSIVVDSRPGQGATVSVTLPTAQPEPFPPTEAAPHVDADGGDGPAVVEPGEPAGTSDRA